VLSNADNMESTLIQEHFNARVSAESCMQVHRLQDALHSAREAAQLSRHLATLHAKHNVDAILDLILLIDILLAVEDPDEAYQCMNQAEKLLHASLTAIPATASASSTAATLVSAGLAICHCLEDFNKVRRAESLIGKILEACTRSFGSDHSLTLKGYAEFTRISQLMALSKGDASTMELVADARAEDDASSSSSERDLDWDIQYRRVHDLIAKAGLEYVTGLEARQAGQLGQAVVRFLAAQALYSQAVDNCDCTQLDPAFREASQQVHKTKLSAVSIIPYKS
jgi:tetratricopeptide (TPR) repeat protein